MTDKTTKPDNTADWIAYLDEKLELTYDAVIESLLLQRDVKAAEVARKYESMHAEGEEYTRP